MDICIQQRHLPSLCCKDANSMLKLHLKPFVHNMESFLFIYLVRYDGNSLRLAQFQLKIQKKLIAVFQRRYTCVSLLFPLIILPICIFKNKEEGRFAGSLWLIPNSEGFRVHPSATSPISWDVLLQRVSASAAGVATAAPQLIHEVSEAMS